MPQVDTDHIVRQGVRLLAHLVEPDGAFVQCFDPVTGAVQDRHNLIRHCGAVVLLNQARDAYPDIAESGFDEAILRAARFIVDGHLMLANSFERCWAVDGDEVRTGATGMAATALAAVFGWHDPPYLMALLGNLGRELRDAQHEDGSFVHKRDVETGEPLNFRSKLYDSQAVLGLIQLYEALGDDTLLDAAVRGGTALMERHAGLANRFHGTAHALEALDAHRPAPPLMAHMDRLAGAVLNNDSYRKTGETLTIASRTHVLLAAIRMRRLHGGLDRDHEDTLVQAIERNLGLLMHGALDKGGFLMGGTGPDATRVRLDNLTHAVSVFLQYDLLLKALERPQGTIRI